MKWISTMLVRLYEDDDIWEWIDVIIMLAIIIGMVGMIVLVCISFWWLIATLFYILFGMSFLIRLNEGKYQRRRLLYVDFLEDYLAMKQKYVELKKKNELVINMKDKTRII